MHAEEPMSTDRKPTRLLQRMILPADLTEGERHLLKFHLLSAAFTGVVVGSLGGEGGNDVVAFEAGNGEDRDAADLGQPLLLGWGITRAAGADAQAGQAAVDQEQLAIGPEAQVGRLVVNDQKVSPRQALRSIPVGQGRLSE